MKIDYFKPSITNNEIRAVEKVLKSGWLTTGKQALIFEKNFSNLFKKKIYCISVNSCTAALHLALEAIGIKKGDEVICPILTFTATAEAIRYLNAKPIFVDIDLKDYNLDIDEVKKKINKKTKAIIPVHFAGRPVNISKLYKLCKLKKISIIDDAAHALPAIYKSQTIGDTNFDATAFSFYVNKTITTGEGGMLVSKSKKIIDRARIMRSHGISKDVFERFRIGSEKQLSYDIVAPGFKYNLTDIAASIGIQQLKKLNIFQKKRKKIAIYYSKKLSKLPLILPKTDLKSITSSWHLYVVRLNSKAKITRDELVKKLSDKKIGTSLHYKPLHMMSYWKKFIKKNQKFHKADKYYQSCISLPIYPSLKKKEIDYIIKTLQKLL
jgi:dTDP-4-amino-4,6-dideoxygalactose transaminase